MWRITRLPKESDDARSKTAPWFVAHGNPGIARHSARGTRRGQRFGREASRPGTNRILPSARPAAPQGLPPEEVKSRISRVWRCRGSPSQASCTGTLEKVCSTPLQCMRPKPILPPREKGTLTLLSDFSHLHRRNSFPLPSGPESFIVPRPEGLGPGGDREGGLQKGRVHQLDFVIYDQGPLVKKIKSEATARRWGKGSSTVGWSCCGSVSVTVLANLNKTRRREVALKTWRARHWGKVA